ncbi:TPM domain-containing protein [Meridianimaribacter flavus]|uniref:TPM domain-containing protein n=1 Tax=Meridianimaribacter flavus TaxID=571115 RepID=A0ABY2G9N5_9FLAO|nr:TPM domain-containing protein [Meridianimaribacter flavus]TDY14160.1 uncharacterized protein A8975_0762 [Meridianimaribacter flavus]
MKKTIVLLFIIFISCKGHQPERKNPFSHLPKNEQQNIISDFSNLFSFEEENALSHKIADYESTTTNQIVIITIDSIVPNHLSIQEYAIEIGNYWGVGQYKKDNGLIIAICKPQKQVAIATGYETEKTLTDSICQDIINTSMLPFFKKENYYQGINNALDSIIKKWD